MGKGDSSEVDSDDEDDEKTEQTSEALYEMGMLSLLEKIVATDATYRGKTDAVNSSDFNQTKAADAADEDNGDPTPGETEDALDKDDEDEYEEEEFVYKEIDNLNLTKQEKEDLRTITGLVEKMVEVVSFRHALYMNPGITDWLSNAQHTCWENKIRLDEESLSIDASRKAEQASARHRRDSPRESSRSIGGASNNGGAQAHAVTKRSTSLNVGSTVSMAPRGSSGSTSERLGQAASGGGSWQAEMAATRVPASAAGATSSSGATDLSILTGGPLSSRVEGCSPLSPPGGVSPSQLGQGVTAIPHLPMLQLNAYRHTQNMSGSVSGLPPVAPGSRPHVGHHQLHHLHSSPLIAGHLYREPHPGNYLRQEMKHEEEGAGAAAAEDGPPRLQKQRFQSAPGFSCQRGSSGHTSHAHIHVTAPLPNPATTLSAQQRMQHMACMKTPYGVNNPGAVSSQVVTSYPNANPYLVSGCQSMALQRRVIEIARLQSETMKLEKRKKRRQRHRASLNDIHHRAVNKAQ